MTNKLPDQVEASAPSSLQPELQEWQALVYGDSIETRAALAYWRERGWPVDQNTFPERDRVCMLMLAFKSGYREALLASRGQAPPQLVGDDLGGQRPAAVATAGSSDAARQDRELGEICERKGCSNVIVDPFALTDMERRKDEAYTERNRLVALLSKLWPAHLAQHGDDPSWSEDWRTIVCIHSPQGQLTWHVHDSHVPLFAHLPDGDNHWDGHTTEEKYRRIDSFENGSVIVSEASTSVPSEAQEKKSSPSSSQAPPQLASNDSGASLAAVATDTSVASPREVRKDHYLKAGDLRKALEGVSDDAPVFYQRIEDVYFEKHGWIPLEQQGEEGVDHYVRAFTAWPGLDGRFFITAHF